MKVFSTPLRGQLTNQSYSRTATRLVQQRLAAKHMTLEAYANEYDHAAEVNSKSFIMLMVVPLAIVAWLLFRRAQPAFATHVVFALHFYAFWMLAFFAAIAVVLVLLIGGIAKVLTPAQWDMSFSWLHFAITTTFLYLAVGRVYGQRGQWRAIKLVPLALTTAAMTLGYRFAVLVITLATT